MSKVFKTKIMYLVLLAKTGKTGFIAPSELKSFDFIYNFSYFEQNQGGEL